MRTILFILLLTILHTGCSPHGRGVLGGTLILAGGVGSVSAAQAANSNPDCLACTGDTKTGLVVLAASLGLVVLGVATLAIDVDSNDSDAQ